MLKEIMVCELIEQLQACNQTAIVLVAHDPPAVRAVTGLSILPTGNPASAAWQVVLEIGIPDSWAERGVKEN
jgi:hypothetical protein